jgi:peptide chain release factor 1
MQFTLNDSDLKIEWYSGTGAGGQHRNKHQNSCRLTHIPTNTLVTAQCRSRINSLEQAKQELSARLQQQHNSTNANNTATIRKGQVGSGMRGDKIRTYRFQDDTVKDHITNKSSTVKKILSGQFELLW